MRIIDLDRLELPGKTKILEMLDKWEKEHPVTEIYIGEESGYDIYLVKKGAK